MIKNDGNVQRELNCKKGIPIGIMRDADYSDNLFYTNPQLQKELRPWLLQAKNVADYGMTVVAMAEALARAGAKIVINCRSQEHLDKAMEDFEARGIEVNAYIADVTDESQVKELVKKVFELENINTCPHGRPIMTKMSKYSLEKQFKRT